MSERYDYYRPSVAKDLEKAIEDLFKRDAYVKRFYKGKKGEFVEDAIRRLIIFYDLLPEKKYPE